MNKIRGAHRCPAQKPKIVVGNAFTRNGCRNIVLVGPPLANDIKNRLSSLLGGAPKRAAKIGKNPAQGGPFIRNGTHTSVL